MDNTPNNSRPPVRLLAVDDEPANLTVIAGALFGERYDLRLAQNAVEARQILTDWLPDLVLLDVMMPGESGVELCADLRRKPHLDGIPIVLVTALGAADHRTAGLGAGADDFIEKPLDIDELVSRTASWVARGRSLSPIESARVFENDPDANDPFVAAARQASGKRHVSALVAAMEAVARRR